MKSLTDTKEGTVPDKNLNRQGSVPIRDIYSPRQRPLPGSEEDREARALADTEELLKGEPRPLRSQHD